MARFPAVLLGAALLVSWGPAAAAGKRARPARPAAASKDPVAALVTRARAALASGAHEAAGQALGEAYARRPDPGVLLLLGQVAVAQGRMVAAQDLCRRALAESPDLGDEAARAAAQRAFTTDEPTSELSVLGERGQLVFLDDRLVGRLPLPLPLLVTPGEHRLRLKEEGRERTVATEAPVHRRVELRIERDTGAVLISRLPLVVVQPSGEAVADDVLAKLALAAAARLRAERLSVAVADRGGTARPSASPPVAGTGDVVLKLHVQQPSPGEWNLTLSALDTELREPAAQEPLRCAPCSEEALAERLRERVVPIARAGLERPRGVVRVRSEPPGAIVEIEGTARGQTPLELRRFTGNLMIRLQREGYREALRPVTVVEGQPVEVLVTLDPLPKETVRPLGPILVTRTERLPRPKWRLVLGGVLLGGGALLAGFGGGALAVDGQCIRSPEPPAERCDQLYQTSTLGYSLVGSGAGLALIGAVLLAVPGPQRTYTVPVARDAAAPRAATGADREGVR